MKYKLGELCEIQQGRNVKSSSFCKEGKYVYVSLKDLDSVHTDSFPFTYINTDIHERYLVHEQDVLFSIRGKFNAFLLPRNIKKPAIASSVFVILKPNSSLVLKEYLLWFLNHRTTQFAIKKLTPSNSIMPYISVSKLKNIDIEVPSLTKQKTIVEVFRLQQKEIAITHKITELKNKYIQTILLNSIQK